MISIEEHKEIDGRFRYLIDNFKPCFGNKEHIKALSMLKKIKNIEMKCKFGKKDEKLTQSPLEELCRLKKYVIYTLNKKE